MADAAALTVHLHPLVLINISDHVVRFKVLQEQRRVLGVVIGCQEGRRVDVHNSFEMLVEGEGDGTINLEFFNQRVAQYREVFPRYEILGWYSTGSEPQESDKALNKKFQDLSNNENPFIILLDSSRLTSTADRSLMEDLPVKVYDSTTHLIDGHTSVQLHEVPYAIDTLEAERIAVNHVAKSATTNSTSGHSSDFTQHAGGLGNAVAMLSNRVKELLEHAQAMKDGRVPKNRETMRQMLSICQALRATQPEALRREFCGEFNDAALVVLLASLSKACASTSELMDKFQLTHDKKHRGARQHYPFG
eukprot:TRINITY_DN35124_c0_g1_i1.p1 TRINITY_DN35124_c0_g1~~TRINITY_DN35124_c0_g1_i1.p1  ORF type:complete len:356 (+),score=65.00 TRINITY_DN35124_c0_g1_i1:151-1068(+)